MIDFPNAPVDGQVFNAGSGVMYQWLATPGAWVTYSIPGGAGGDFYVTHPGIALTNALTTMVFNTVLTGNVGGFYNTTTGRFTPPAGRYLISAGIAAGPASGSNIGLDLRKNGVVIPGAYMLNNATSSGWYGSPVAQCIVDANGTDYFDARGSVSVGATTTSAWFMAIPTGRTLPALPVAGDFQATVNAAFTIGASGQVLVHNTVTAGNAGNWYSTSTGRYTPPAGRYYLFAMFSAAGSGGGAIVLTYLRKNGVALPVQAGSSNTPSSTLTTLTTFHAIVDANGTDYFEHFVFSNVATTANCNAYFGAFPLSGVVGPPGPPGVMPGGGLYLYSEQVAVGGETILNVTIPLNAKRVQLVINSQAAAGDPALYLQTVESGVVNASVNHRVQKVYGQSTTAGAAQDATAAAWNFGGTGTTQCVIELMRIPSGTVWSGVSTNHMASTSGPLYIQTFSLDGGANPTTTTGFRATIGASSFVAGSSLRAYVVT
jgi:hypothetical protein